MISILLCFKVIYVYGEGDKYLGKAIQYPTCFLPHLEIWDDNEQKLFDVNGPCCVCCSDTEYPVRKNEFLNGFLNISRHNNTKI